VHRTCTLGQAAREAEKIGHAIGMKMDGNERKNLISISVFIFLAEARLSSENTGTETRSDYAKIRKQTNTDVEPERITRSNILEYTLTKSQNNIHVQSY